MRTASVLLLVLVLSACQKAPNSDAARQAVLDRLASRGMALDTLDVSITAFEQKGNEAEATVSLKLKDSPGGQGMTMKYRMRQQGGKWVDVEPVIAGAAGPHGGVAPPPAPPAGNPHGGSMPSPEDLPPTGKKK